MKLRVVMLSYLYRSSIKVNVIQNTNLSCANDHEFLVTMRSYETWYSYFLFIFYDQNHQLSHEQRIANVMSEHLFGQGRDRR